MNYRLIYAVDGHELQADCPSLGDVNVAIREVYDRNDDHVAVLRIEEEHDGPRTWQIEYPAAPPAGTRVTTKGGTVLEIDVDGLVQRGGTAYGWKYVLEEFGPLTEVVETEVEAAARRLRERDLRGNRIAELNPELWDDVRTVLAHVLNGRQL